MEFEIHSSHIAGLGTLLEPEGDIDVYTSPLLREKLLDASSEGDGPITVSLKRVGFIDSTGLGVLVGELKRAKAMHRELFIVCDEELTLRIFRITGLDKVFKIHPSVETLHRHAQSV